MGKPCKYCAQSGTHKDDFGFCKKYNCFEVSGKKQILEDLLKKKQDVQLTYPTYKRNQFDGIHYNPQEDELRWIDKQIIALLNN